MHSPTAPIHIKHFKLAVYMLNLAISFFPRACIHTPECAPGPLSQCTAGAGCAAAPRGCGSQSHTR